MNHSFMQCTFGYLWNIFWSIFWNLLLLICEEVDEVLRVQISFSKLEYSA